MKPTGPPQDATQQSSLRSTLLLALVLAIIAGGTAAYSMLFVAVRYEVSMTPETLAPIPGEQATLRVHGVSRAGYRVPWSDQNLHCEILEGGELIELTSEADSTYITLLSTGREGTVTLRIRIPDWPFPLLAEFRITAPLAYFLRTSSTNYRGMS